MSTTLRLDGPGDAELISAVRGGNVDAYGELFRRHVDAARRLARQLRSGTDVDDLVSEAFAKVLGVLQRGGGPDLAFRAYLLTAVRRLHIDRLRQQQRVQPTDDLEAFDPGVPFRDTAVEGFENATAAKAFASLPERWQMVLWHTEVEGQRPAEVAPLLGMSANSVSALAYRAREGLRQAFLTMHAQAGSDEGCRWTHAQLGGYVRGGLSRRDTAKVEEHLEGCRSCTAAYLELREVNSNLSGLLAPLLLGAAAAGYLAGGAALKTGVVLLLLDRVKDFVAANLAVSAAAGATGAAVVTGGVVAATQLTGPTSAPTFTRSPQTSASTLSPGSTPEGPPPTQGWPAQATEPSTVHPSAIHPSRPAEEANATVPPSAPTGDVPSARPSGTANGAATPTTTPTATSGSTDPVPGPTGSGGQSAQIDPRPTPTAGPGDSSDAQMQGSIDVGVQVTRTTAGPGDRLRARVVGQAPGRVVLRVEADLDGRMTTNNGMCEHIGPGRLRCTLPHPGTTVVFHIPDGDTTGRVTFSVAGADGAPDRNPADNSTTLTIG